LLTPASRDSPEPVKNAIFDPKTSKPSISKYIMTLEIIENLKNFNMTSIHKLIKHGMKRGNIFLCIKPKSS
jgi:hypothetical protein